MKFQVGDPVVLKHTGSEGRITAVENNGMYLVLIDGVEIPVFGENLDHPYFDWFTKERDQKKKLKFVHEAQIPIEKETTRQKIVSGTFLGFFPEFDKNDDALVQKFKLYLINQDQHHLFFQYRLAHQQKTVFRIQGHTLPFTNFYIHDVGMELMHEQPSFLLKFYDHHRPDARLVSQQEIKIRPKKLFEHLLRIQNGEYAYFQIPIDIRDPDHQEEVQVLDIGAKKILQSQDHKGSKIIEEIDLHIERLQENYAHLSNAEIVHIQMTACEQAIDLAIRNGQISLTIIHGVGKGVLKEEIHHLLRSIPEVRYFISDWMPKYGLGATQVFF